MKIQNKSNAQLEGKGKKKKAREEETQKKKMYENPKYN